jgi:hypothetical protein
MLNFLLNFKDMHGQPMFTYENLVLFIIYIIVIFFSFSLRAGMIWGLSSKKLRREKRRMLLLREMCKNKNC